MPIVNGLLNVIASVIRTSSYKRVIPAEYMAICPHNADRICGHIHIRIIVVECYVLPYHILHWGWAGYYTCPALRPYQFCPMRNPDVTKGHSNQLWSGVVVGCEAEVGIEAENSPAT